MNNVPYPVNQRERQLILIGVIGGFAVAAVILLVIIIVAAVTA